MIYYMQEGIGMETSIMPGVQPLWVRTLWLMPEVLHPAKVTPLQLRAASQKIPIAKHETLPLNQHHILSM
jgi:hypothetical protein